MEPMVKNNGAARLKLTSEATPPARPTRAEAEEAVRTLLAWSGDDPGPRRAARYPKAGRLSVRGILLRLRRRSRRSAVAHLRGVAGYDDMVMLRDIRVQSHCEHHIAPFVGVAHIAYLPRDRVVGLSKLARVVEIFASRLQTQEKLTAQVASAIETVL